MIFKYNSEFIIPFVIKDVNIFKNNITFSRVETGVLYNYLYIDIIVDNKKSLSTILSILKKEPNLNSMYIKDNKIKSKFIIDKNLDFFIIPIINNGYDALTRDDLRDCVLFWKESFVKILCNK